MAMGIREFVVLTGASRGIGAALAWQLLSPARHLVCIARTLNPTLVARAQELAAPLEYFQLDLADADGTDALAKSISTDVVRAVADGGCRRIVLINNAGLVEPIGLASQLDLRRAVVTFQVNLLAAMTFTARFLAASDGFDIERRVLNVSSGAGRKPIEGWSVYGASKAALDMYTRCVKAEQLARANPARICSLAPGVVDTEMQATVRGANADDCPAVGRLRDLKTAGMLVSADETARRIVDYLERPDFGDRELDDIRNY